MSTTLVRTLACASAGALLVALSACNQSLSPTASAPLRAPQQVEESTPQLAGGPAPAAAPTPTAVPAARPAPAPVQMAAAAPPPLTAAQQAWMKSHDWKPNPEDLIYRTGPNGVVTVTMRPIPNPKAAPQQMLARNDARPAKTPDAKAPVQLAAAKPAPKAAAAKPAAPVALAKATPAPAPTRPDATATLAKAAPAPKAAPTAPVAVAALAPPAKPQPSLEDRLGQLSTALAVEMRSAKLEVAPADASGKPGKVAVKLPASLAASIQQEAAKLGLEKDAARISVAVKLGGAGSVGPETLSAKLDPGQQTDFLWQVKPGAKGAAPLTADITGSLEGAGSTKAFPLGALMADAAATGAPAAAVAQAATDTAPAAAPEPAKPASKLSLKTLAIPGHPTVKVPGVGDVASENIVAGAIVLVILLILAAIANGSGQRRNRAERRRMYAAFEAADTGAVAGAGAAVAAVAAAHDAHGHDAHGHDAHGHDDHGHGHGHDDHGHGDHGDHGHGGHDDHGHGHDAHGHDDHGHGGHGDHGHDAHGHDDHGHGHDDHGHGHDDHGHGHDDHGHGHDDHGHGHDAHAHAHAH